MERFFDRLAVSGGWIYYSLASSVFVPDPSIAVFETLAEVDFHNFCQEPLPDAWESWIIESLSKVSGLLVSSRAKNLSNYAYAKAYLGESPPVIARPAAAPQLPWYKRLFS